MPTDNGSISNSGAPWCHISGPSQRFVPVLELEDVLREGWTDTVHLCTPVEPFSIYPLSTDLPLSPSQLGPREREVTKSSQLTPFTLNTDIIEDGCISGLHPISDLKMDLSLLIVSTIPRRAAMREAMDAQGLFTRCDWGGSGKWMDKNIGAIV